MNQLSMSFDAPMRRIETPAFRRSDPESSRIAAEKVTASGIRQSNVRRVAEAVRGHPGVTSYEAAQICGMDRVEAGRRMSDAEAAGLIRKGDMGRQPNGNPAVTWWPE